MSNYALSVGIDLGTNNSSVSTYVNGKIQTIPNRLGEYVTPSCVLYTENKTLIGELATKNMNAICYSKRLIGRTYDEAMVENMNKYGNIKIVNDHGIPKYQVENMLIHPEQISAHILDELKTIAEDFTNMKTISDAVIAVPAYFNDSQRQATIDAAKIVGLNVLRLINEPTAAAIAYYHKLIDGNPDLDINVLVYDFGAGTFDVSIIHLTQKYIKTIATAGNCTLGGIDIDNIIYKFVSKKLEEAGIWMEGLRPKSIHAIRKNVEKAKEELAGAVSTYISYNDEEIMLTREQLEKELLSSNILDETMKVVFDCLKNANLDTNDIQEVILVGGSCKIAGVEDLLSSHFKKITKTLSSEKAVSQGAAILAAKLNGAPILRNTKILDVISTSLGIHTLSDHIDILIKRNTQLPTKEFKQYSLGVPNKNALEISIFEGEDPIASNNIKLGRFDILNLLPNAQLDVEFNIDINGIITVTAVETETGRCTCKVISYKGRLEEDQIKKLQLEYKFKKKKSIQYDRVTIAINDLHTFIIDNRSKVKNMNVSLKQREIFENMCVDTLQWSESHNLSDSKVIMKRKTLEYYLKHLLNYKNECKNF